jgi:hypothetical protein
MRDTTYLRIVDNPSVNRPTRAATTALYREASPVKRIEKKFASPAWRRKTILHIPQISPQ